MKKLTVFAAMILAAGFAVAGESPQGRESATLSPTTYITGDIFTGDYVRIGINDFGTIGVGQGFLGVGLQWAGDTPFAYPTTESLAIAYWGEGFLVGYNEMNPFTLAPTLRHEAFYQPDFGAPLPAFTNLSVVPGAKLVHEFDNSAFKEVVLTTNDGLLRLTFSFVFDKLQPGLVLKTQIQNLSTKPLRDVVYKRIVDFDVLASFYNDWSAGAFEATAAENVPGGLGYVPTGLDLPARMTVSGQQGHQQPLKRSFLVPMMPTLVDLWAWDDITTRAPMRIENSHMMTEDDCNAALHYSLGYFAPGESKDVFTIYQTNFPKK